MAHERFHLIIPLHVLDVSVDASKFHLPRNTKRGRCIYNYVCIWHSELLSPCFISLLYTVSHCLGGGIRKSQENIQALAMEEWQKRTIQVWL